MLTALSLRNVVLIEQVDFTFGHGLTVLTGETGAGKSILLDGLSLALGARADPGLVRAGANQASAVAQFHLSADHPAIALLAEQGLPVGNEILLRRVVSTDGRSQAFVNDSPVSVGLLRRFGALLVEVQGQHEQMGLLNPATHLELLDAFGVPPALRLAVAEARRAWQEAEAALAAARAALTAAERDREWLTHAVDELDRLAPKANEEELLADERKRLQQKEKQAEAIGAALTELAPRDRRSTTPAAALRAASRTLRQLILSTNRSGEGTETEHPAALALAALERAEEAVAEAEMLLTRLLEVAEPDPRALEAAEERLFALRAAARKHHVTVADLPALADKFRAQLAALQNSSADVAALTSAAKKARENYCELAAKLADARMGAARHLEQQLAKELPSLHLEKARFFVEIQPLPETGWSSQGTETARFLIATNPGQPPGPLARIASGGELSRLMLALKVVLVAALPIPTLIFDEVDSDIGGATAAAVGERLARLAKRVQVLVITHSPQVAARGDAHWHVFKRNVKGGTITEARPLDLASRREEIARMLAGETVTEAARAAATSLLGHATL
jgi:DNA repair protein RecN (Recombination protein N)